MTTSASASPAAWPDLAGRLVGGRHVLAVRVYYEDTDFSGVVYHASYLRFLERGRTDFLRLLGVGHAALAAGAFGEPLAFAVKSLAVDYRAAGRIDEVLEVETRLGALGGARIGLDQTIRRGDAVIVAATVTVVVLSPEGRPRRLPAAVAARLRTGAPPAG
jgi:acyl-CoA thioester hydrolase